MTLQKILNNQTHKASLGNFVPTLLFTQRNLKLMLVSFLLIFNGFIASGQSYLGRISKQVNLREGPGTEYPIIASLKPESQIFIVSLETDNDFCNIIYIATNQSGYVHKNYITVTKELPQSEGGFTPSGSSGQENPEAAIYNNTDKTMTLKLNSELYTFKPQEKKTLILSATEYAFIASAPGVVPNHGNKDFEKNTKYTWEFYIVKRYR